MVSFRKSIGLGGGVRINISKSGFGVSAGPKGAKISVNSKGTYINAGIPGTGVYHRSKLGENSNTNNVKGNGDDFAYILERKFGNKAHDNIEARILLDKKRASYLNQKYRTSSEVIDEIIGTGEVLRIRYYGGSQPGNCREIVPIDYVGDDKIEAFDVYNNENRWFFIDKIIICDKYSWNEDELYVPGRRPSKTNKPKKEYNSTKHNKFTIKNAIIIIIGIIGIIYISNISSNNSDNNATQQKDTSDNIPQQVVSEKDSLKYLIYANNALKNYIKSSYDKKSNPDIVITTTNYYSGNVSDSIQIIGYVIIDNDKKHRKIYKALISPEVSLNHESSYKCIKIKWRKPINNGYFDDGTEGDENNYDGW